MIDESKGGSPLYDEIRGCAGRQAPALVKHLRRCGVGGWGDLTRAGLYRLRDELGDTCAPGTARTYMATLKAVLSRYEDEGLGFCPDFRDVLRGRAETTVKTYLTPAELGRLRGADCRTAAERAALSRFLLGAFTGMRVSDATAAGPECVSGGVLTYTSIKTGVTASVPAGAGVADWLAMTRDGVRLSLTGYNAAIRRLCRRAGIASTVRVHRAGRDETGPKWAFVSSHTARISFATNLARAGVPLIDLSRMMGHTSTAMTERYIVPTAPRLTERAMAYFK